MTICLKCDPGSPDESTLRRVIPILRHGGVIAFPTETFYGLGADARQEEAVEKIFRIKGRNARNPVSVIVDNEGELNNLVTEIPPSAHLLMHQFWPGPLTLVFYSSPSVSPILTGGTGKIGIRISSHPIARLLTKRLAGPITATSANRSGGPECSTAEEVISDFGDRLDAIIDSGKTTGGLGSTILDMTVSPPMIIREGAIPLADILGTPGIFQKRS